MNSLTAFRARTFPQRGRSRRSAWDSVYRASSWSRSFFFRPAHFSEFGRRPTHHRAARWTLRQVHTSPRSSRNSGRATAVSAWTRARPLPRSRRTKAAVRAANTSAPVKIIFLGRSTAPPPPAPSCDTASRV